MTEEEKNEITEEPEDAPEAEVEETPAVEETTEDQAPAAEEGAKEASEDSVEAAPAEEEEAPAEEEEAPAEEEEPPAEDAEAAPAAAEEGEAPEALSPKQKRKLERSSFAGEPSPQRTPEERAAERVEARRKAKEARRRVRARAREKKGEAGTGTPPAERVPGNPKVRQGTVVSDKAEKTITVEIELARRHPAYEKIVRNSRKLHAHDEANEAREGDVVRVIETRPLSKTKRWRLDEVVERAPSR